jgi:hypothetical protein
MDSNTKQRYISTSIWSDEWFDSLSALDKLIYFHLLTNEFTNAAGVYHFSLKQIRIDLDITRDEVNAAMERFAAAGKAYYYQEYIIIPKWLKHQKISARSKMFLGAVAILRGLPDGIKRFIAGRQHYDFPVEKYVEIPPADSLCPVEDSLCLKNDSLSENGSKNGIGYAENAANSAHDSDSDSDSDLDIKEFNAENFSEPPPEPPEDQTLPTAEAVVLKPPDSLPPEPPENPPVPQDGSDSANLPAPQGKPPAFSPVDSPPKKGGKLELTPEQNELYRAAKACFESSERAKAIMYQDEPSAKMQMRKLKEIVVRCSNIAPGITVDFLKNVLEHFKTMANSAKYRGSWVFTPRCLSTHWIWEIVIASLPERETELDKNIQESIKGLFKR